MTEELWQFEWVHQTEWFAAFLAKFGYVPSAAWGRHYANSPDAYRRGQVNITRRAWWEGISLIQTGHPDWRFCPECNRILPETKQYWHSDSHGRNGLQTLCKSCRCDRERARYRERVIHYAS